MRFQKNKKNNRAVLGARSEQHLTVRFRRTSKEEALFVSRTPWIYEEPLFVSRRPETRVLFLFAPRTPQLGVVQLGVVQPGTRKKTTNHGAVYEEPLKKTRFYSRRPGSIQEDQVLFKKTRNHVVSC